MRAYADVEVIVSDDGINYNYKGFLYTEEQFKEKILNERTGESLEFARIAVRAWQRGETSGFYPALVQAISRADLQNKNRLATAFPAIVEAYDEYMEGRL